MRTFLISLILTTTINFAFGQQKTLAKFIIIDASDNNVDITETILEQKAYSVFYTRNDSNLYMANVWQTNNSQSFGRLYASDRKN